MPQKELPGFPDPGREKQVMAAWERFLNSNEMPPHMLRTPIEGSWWRCLRAGVDPTRRQAPTVLAAEHLTALRARHHELIAASLPIMAQAREFLSESGTIMMLTDARGVVLHTEGDPRALEAAIDIRLIPGASWAESECGTNAIGTALATKAPVQVHASEHFCFGIKPWTCSAAVVHDPANGEVLGVLDVSGLQSTFNHHCLALALIASDRIEGRLAAHDLELRERLLEEGLGRFSRLASGGLLFFDQKGRFIKADASAATMLGAIAVELDTKAESRIEAFSADALPASTSSKLPDWLKPEWVEPIVDGKQRLGTIVVLPEQWRRSSTSQRLAPAGENVSRAEVAVPGTSKPPFMAEDIVGAARALRAVLALASKVAPTDSTVLITGETGTGKELIAQVIHKRSRRAARAFVSVNCAAIPQTLITSELFGHERGAFTGALQRRVGRFELAEGGTLFLDEVGELPPETQIALLRVLQEREFERVGGTKPIRTDVRVIAATNRDLQAAISSGSFRRDLFYRLNVFPIEIPPLRHRKEDIPRLVEYFVDRYASKAGKRFRTISAQTLDLLQSYSWPGNIRELQNVIERSVIVCDSETFSVDDSWLSRETGSTRPTSQQVADKHAAQAEQKAMIEAALAKTRGRVSGLGGAAAALGMPPNTLETKIRTLGINKYQFRAR
jgi:sigma-54 dependent transcriptional regulator, acetoin dehydrogenase operon transcriptional activator AcoR